MVIHRLPSEILGSIFLHTAYSYSCFKKIDDWRCAWNALIVIPSVCSQWRQVAIRTRTLWNHIDFDEDHRNEQRSLYLLDRTQLWLERAQGVPIHVHFLTSHSWIGQRQVAKVISILQLHIPLVASLICPHGLGIGVVNALFPLWENLTQPASLKTLRLKGMHGPDAVPWAPILQGLADLQLVHIYGDNLPTFDQLVQMMLGSPHLHTLRLSELRGSVIEEDDHKYAPITLGNLRLLDISSSDMFLVPLLSLLSTGPLPLDLRIRALPDPETINVIASFLERSKITSLAIDYGHKDDFSGEAPPDEWTSRLSHMRMLVMASIWTNCPSVDKLVTLIDGVPTARFPNLHTLVLFHCRNSRLAPHRIKQVVNAYSLHRIVFIESRDEYLRDEYPDDIGEDADETALRSDDDYGYTPEWETWLNERIDTVIFEDEYYWPGRENEEWDPYVEELMASLDT
ncbi:hypothetical protein FS749_001939 [Ceratobasidium sp. UAMH 11750]|nr:hypothetical protein FS749_001939 [Ceratobasidium sp. UAMH 11750]